MTFCHLWFPYKTQGGLFIAANEKKKKNNINVQGCIEESTFITHGHRENIKTLH